jgi:HEAT repeat protein
MMKRLLVLLLPILLLSMFPLIKPFGGDRSGMVAAANQNSAAVEKLTEIVNSVRPGKTPALGTVDAILRLSENNSDIIPDIISALTGFLKDADPGVRGLAADALGSMPKSAKSAIPQLIINLDDANPDVRWRIALALGSMPEAAKSAIPGLIKCLEDPDLSVRDFAAGALGAMGESAKSAVPILISLLKHADPAVRGHAASNLGSLGKLAESAIPQLSTLLNDDNPDVRSRATDALTKIESALKRGKSNL